MIVAPRGAVEGWGRLSYWAIEDINRALFMLFPKFSAEGKSLDLSRNHWTWKMRLGNMTARIYRVSPSQYDCILMMR